MIQQPSRKRRRGRNVTVFGGSGFIGRHLVKRLAAAGDTVRVAGRDPERAHFLQPLGDVGQIVAWPVDYNDTRSVTEALRDADAAVNLVGILFESGFGARRRTFENAHTRIPERIAKAAARMGVSHLVHVSAIGADRQAKADYARSKGRGEAALRRAFPDATILRPSVVFGAEDNFFNRFAGLARFAPALPVLSCSLPRLIFPKEGGLPTLDLYGSGGPRFQPVFVGDVAEACLRALDDPKAPGKTYELGGPTVYSFHDLMRLLLKQVDRKRFLMPIPLPIARVMAAVLGRLPDPLLTADQVRLLERDNVVSRRALKLADLGIEPAAAEAILPGYLGRFSRRQAVELPAA